MNALVFKVHGGHGAVKLLCGDQVVRVVRARHDNANDLAVRFDLRSFRGEPLQVQIEDAAVDPWGFITVSAMHFE